MKDSRSKISILVSLRWQLSDAKKAEAWFYLAIQVDLIVQKSDEFV